MSLMQDQIEALRQAMSQKSGDHNMKPCVRDDIIRMAREAGLLPIDIGPTIETWQMRRKEESLVRFAALVAAAEREAIAKSLDKQADLACDEIDRKWAKEMAAAVRARGDR